jgi:hypothetical protein
VKLADIKKLADELNSRNSNSACPACGHCPHCGRGGYRTLPLPYPNPWPYPYSPYTQPMWGSGTEYTTSGMIGLPIGQTTTC